MENLYTQKVINANNVFDGSFLDAKMLYLFHFNCLPSVHFIGQIDGEKVLAVIREKLDGQIRDIHQSNCYQPKQKRFGFGRTIVVLKQECLLEFNAGWCEIFHNGKQKTLIDTIVAITTRFRERTKREPREINLIIQNGSYLDLKAMEIKRVKLDIGRYYEDDFAEVDETITKRLNKKNDKGIVLLHGLPGTGKTTYLRHLVGKIKKRVLFLSPSVAGNLMSPDFIELLVDNPNTVLIIEDAESVIMDRRYHQSAAVSNLLNVSDGLLADFLNVQLVCTFNSNLATIDSALLRKGRLIARYEFGKLGVRKAQALSDYLDLGKTITEPMTMAEIVNAAEKDQPVRSTEVIGFRRKEMLN
jgi:SpoVK/Ycf46/Vps4 family AAA+-type ATPase